MRVSGSDRRVGGKGVRAPFYSVSTAGSGMYLASCMYSLDCAPRAQDREQFIASSLSAAIPLS